VSPKGGVSGNRKDQTRGKGQRDQCRRSFEQNIILKRTCDSLCDTLYQSEFGNGRDDVINSYGLLLLRNGGQGSIIVDPS